MLTLAQMDLIKEYWIRYSKTTNKKMTLDEFVNIQVGVNFADLEYCHIKTIKESVMPLTTNQIAFLKEIYKYLDIPMQICFTQKEFSEHLVELSKKHNLYIPKYLYLRNIRYDIKESSKDYLIGKQIHLNQKDKNILDVIILKDVMMIDYDNQDYKKLKQVLKKQPYTFWVYETHKGYHCYCMSATFDHREFASIQYMYKLGCDQIYISFTKTFGYVVRLSKKKNRKERFVEKFVEQINDYPIINRNKFLLEKKDTLIKSQIQD